MTTTVNQANEDQAKSWYQKQQELHGKEKFPDEPDSTVSEDLLESGKNTLERLSEFTGAGRLYTVAGLSFLVKEPTVRQLKTFLLPAAHKFQGANPEDFMEALKGLDEFQRLMLECLEFEEGKKPADLVDWSDNLTVTDGLKLVNVFADGIDWAKIMEEATLLQGKIQGVRVRASRR